MYSLYLCLTLCIHTCGPGIGDWLSRLIYSFSERWTPVRAETSSLYLEQWLTCSKYLVFVSWIHSRKCFTILQPLEHLQRRQWQPTPVLLPRKSHGQRSLVGCSPWGCTESDMTEWLHFHFSLSCIGEGNGNPLQCSCLENPRDGSLMGCCLWGRTESDTTEAT